MALLASTGISGCIRVGIGWGREGSLAGFFPFSVSLAALISCGVNLPKIIKSPADGELFADWGQLRQVTSVVIPTAIYVALIPYIGIYVSSALLIALFMKWLGKYSWAVVIGISGLVPVLTFLMFEMWFLVPLPKGPLEVMLGY